MELERPDLRLHDTRRRPPRPRTGRIVALLVVVLAIGLLAGRVLLGSPSTPAPVVATQDVSVVTVTEGTETVTVTR